MDPTQEVAVYKTQRFCFRKKQAIKHRSYSLHKGPDFIYKRARRSSSLRVLSRTMEAMVKGN